MTNSYREELKKYKYFDWEGDRDFRKPNTLPWLKLSIGTIPVDEVYKEFIKIKHLLVDHRSYESNIGWKSICLHGISPETTNHWSTLGLTECPKHNWTSISDLCPVTKKWLSGVFPNCNGRIRFMLLEPGGYIDLHSDYKEPKLAPVNISITQPLGCDFIWEDWGTHPWETGQAYLMNVYYKHKVVNQSARDRLHIIADGHQIEKELVKRSFFDSLQSLGISDY